MTPDNKRRFQRIPFEADITLALTDSAIDPITGTLQDICLKGALLKLNNSTSAIEVGNKGELAIKPAQAEFELHFTVELAYVLPDISAVGVNIMKLDVDSAAHLRRLIEVNLGSDESLQRELASLVSAMEEEHQAS